MNNYQITATHQAYGTVTFTIAAEDEKKAFTAWKQIVSRPSQWIVRSNTAVDVLRKA